MKLRTKAYTIIYFIFVIIGVFLIFISDELIRFYIEENYTYDPIVFEFYGNKILYFGFITFVTGIVGLFFEKYKKQ
jgi:hypothetical protein